MPILVNPERPRPLIMPGLVPGILFRAAKRIAGTSPAMMGWLGPGVARAATPAKFDSYAAFPYVPAHHTTA